MSLRGCTTGMRRGEIRCVSAAQTAPFQLRQTRRSLRSTVAASSRRRRPRFRPRASALDSERGKAGEWLNMAFPHNHGFKDESDGALREALNEVCNMTLTALLREDDAEIFAIQEELYSLGAFFSDQGNRKAATLMFVLYKLCDHEIPDASEQLDGLYREAFLKIGGMLEDSGWQLKREGTEEEDD